MLKEENNLFVAFLKSPIGNLKVCATQDGIRSVDFTDDFEKLFATDKNLAECVNQLDEYFSGKRKEFSVKLDLQGTPFQKKIWARLLEIPFGKTMSYMEMAMKYGDVKSIRAIGMANSKNPVAIIVPCHRVIGANGELTGYAGGLSRKKWLLDLEGAIQPDLFSSMKAL